MKATSRISILLNLVLLGGMMYMLANRRNPAAASAPIVPEARPSVQEAAPAPPATSDAEPVPFRWNQLLSAKDYGRYIANLRAIGCPEATIEDIVRGDTDRAFSWERSQLSLDGTGNGPWSQAREAQLVASLLSDQSSTETGASAQSTKNPGQVNHDSEVAQASGPPQNEGAAAPAYPLLLQNVNWSGLGFTADQQAAIAQVRQQYLDQMSHANPDLSSAANQNPGSASQNSNPTDGNSSPANSDPENLLPALLGAQGYAAYQQQQYYAWYQPQVLANAGGGNLSIDPHAFSLK